MSGEALTYVEIDIGYCALTYGVPPCQASLTNSPPTGTAKCFNSFPSCQDTPNFTEETKTLRFALATSHLPRDIDIIGPWVEDVDYSPSIVSLGESLGQRASVKVVFSEHRHSDADDGLDRYHDERGYNPYEQGTFWARLRARHVSLRGRALRLITGFVGDTLAEMETRHFWIESFDGPKPDGKFSITAKDALKFLDGDRAQAPALSNGFLVADITDVAVDATLSPAGIGNTEYPGGGYVNLGGNEVSYFSRDPHTKLLLHFDGNDAATSTADIDLANPRAVTFNGSAQLDTGQFKFGTASLQLGALGNYISLADHDDWFLGTGNSTIDLHCRFTTVPSGAADGNFNNILFWQFVDNSNRVIAGFDGTTIVFLATAAGVAMAGYSATHAMSNNTWHHFRFVRSGTSFFIFKDGVALSLTTITAIGSNSLPNLAAPLIIGGATIAGPDWLDEFRWRKGIADTTTGFTAPTAAHPLIGSGDAIRLNRAQFGTEASSHDAQDRAQLSKHYDAVSPDIIIADLIENYTDLDPSYIDNAAWAAEVAANLNRVYTTIITEPTGVAKLVSELIEQATLALWDDNIEQQLRLQVLRGINTNAATFDESNALSFSVMDQPDKRVSRVQVYFGIIDPTKRIDDPDNYRSTAESADAEAEQLYGAAAIRKIYSRWIPQGGRTHAERIADIFLARYSTAPRKFGLGLFRGNVSAPELGGGYRVQWWSLQNPDGSREDVPTQLIRLNPSAEKFQIDLEEMRFDSAAEDLTNRVVTIDFNDNNLNWKNLHDDLYPEIESGQTATLIIAAGAIVGSTSTSVPALDVGTWPAGVTLALQIVGRVQGKGGDGGSKVGGTEFPGLPGGTSLYTREAVNLTSTSGEIWGGGGGGGAEDDGAGGGGAGQLPGAGGSSAGVGAAPGTTEAGGAGAGGAGGDGGGPGLAGESTADAAGGAAGAAIDGDSFVTDIGAVGDIRGSQIN